MFEKYAKLKIRIPDPRPKHIPCAHMELRREYLRRISVNIIPHARTPLLRRAAADLEGFAHSAAAGPEGAQEAQKRRLAHVKDRSEARFADFSLNYRLPVDIFNGLSQRSR